MGSSRNFSLLRQREKALAGAASVRPLFQDLWSASTRPGAFQHPSPSVRPHNSVREGVIFPCLQIPSTEKLSNLPQVSGSRRTEILTLNTPRYLFFHRCKSLPSTPRMSLPGTRGSILGRLRAHGGLQVGGLCSEC